MRDRPANCYGGSAAVTASSSGGSVSRRTPPSTAFPRAGHGRAPSRRLRRLVAGPTDDPRSLNAGDLLAFAGNASHAYRTDDIPADVTVVIASPAIG
ncbi:hypothetical protein [Actinoallomurus sp. NPDC052274]|uniref:hypothetical protein n=1 Tax=Actinoallomurus sp. NPDC052274 TaxID=3155420 RepID=UPI0034125450